MIVYLAGFNCLHKEYKNDTKDIYLLSSFFDFQRIKNIPNFVYQNRHILDSGAFSTFRDPINARTFDWDNYVKNYIQFIKQTNQNLFFELDIDAVIGLEKVEYYRKLIEDSTGKSPIPVWHCNRGWEYFEMMCESYPYVSLGTTMANKQGQLIRKNPFVLTKFIDTAHKKGCKIHGLGFTKTNQLHKFKFDSVDSTTWIGARFGTVFVFKNNKVKQYTNKKKRLISNANIRIHNFNEWVKYQKYAEKNL